jgi:hypothetical protein
MSWWKRGKPQSGKQIFGRTYENSIFPHLIYGPLVVLMREINEKLRDSREKKEWWAGQAILLSVGEANKILGSNGYICTWMGNDPSNGYFIPPETAYAVNRLCKMANSSVQKHHFIPRFILRKFAPKISLQLRQPPPRARRPVVVISS